MAKSPNHLTTIKNLQMAQTLIKAACEDAKNDDDVRTELWNRYQVIDHNLKELMQYLILKGYPSSRS